MPASYAEHDSIHHVPHLGLLIHDGVDDVHVHILLLGIDLEHPYLGLLEHVDLPVLVILSVSLLLLVEHDTIGDVLIHVLALGVGLEHLRLLMHVELPASC
jgi:hypothetical protein